MRHRIRVTKSPSLRHGGFKEGTSLIFSRLATLPRTFSSYVTALNTLSPIKGTGSSQSQGSLFFLELQNPAQNQASVRE